MSELDASRLIVEAIRQIRASTTDGEVDAYADRVERMLARTQFASCHWVRELLFRYRAVRLGGPEERAPFIALVARACHLHMLRPAAAHLLDQLASGVASANPVVSPERKQRHESMVEIMRFRPGAAAATTRSR